MRKIYRNVLLFISIVIFFVVAPILVFYALGYRYDFRNNKLDKVGMLVVESQPREVNIYLNNKLKSSKTPFKAMSLKAGKYKIKLQKAGFQKWEKTLPVKSRVVNWASNINLFYDNPEMQKLNSENKFDNFEYLPKKDSIILISNEAQTKGLWKFDLVANKLSRIFPTEMTGQYANAVFSDLKISNNDKYIFFSWEVDSAKHYVITDTKNIINLDKYLGYSISNIKWSKKYNSRVYWIYQNNLYSYDAGNNTLSNVLLSNIENYDINDDYVVFAKKENNKSLLKRTKENNFNEEHLITESPENKEIDNIKLSKKFNLAFTIKEGPLYLLKNPNESDEFVVSRIFDAPKDFIWNKEGDKLLYYNNNEIWFYELINAESNIPQIHYEYKVNNANLVLRTDMILENAKWYFDFEHILYNTNGNLNVIELDERSIKNTANLKINCFDFEIDKNGEYLYFLNSDKELYKAKITEINTLL